MRSNAHPSHLPPTLSPLARAQRRTKLRVGRNAILLWLSLAGTLVVGTLALLALWFAASPR